MKYVRFENKIGNTLYGLLLEDGRIEEIANPFESTSIEHKGNYYNIDDVVMLSPAEPTKAVCIGLNYRDHVEECHYDIPTTPVVFLKPSTALLRPNGEIIYPEMSHRVDYEAELAIVIGKKAHNVPLEKAEEYILGYTAANDVSARDLQPHNGQWTIAKGFDTFLPLGPYISDEVNPYSLDIECRLNGKTVQKSNTSNLIFDAKFLVSYLSSVMTLLPGDVILTGTPSGISGMQKGDTVEVIIEGLGILRNTVS